MSYFKLLYLFALFNLLTNNELDAQDIINSNWLGWRGQNYGSIELKSPPIIWDIKNSTNIVWKSSILGEGHSSPISDGKFVYITSASKSNLNLTIVNTFALLEILLVIILIYSILRNNFPQTKQYKSHSILIALTVSVLLFMLFILILGDGYFNYSRCKLRVWFITIVVYTLLTMFYFMQLLINNIKAKKIILFLIITFPVFLFLIMPSKSHAFRGGIFQLQSLTSIAALVIPFCLPLLLYIQNTVNINIETKTINVTKTTLPKTILFSLGISFVLFLITYITVYIKGPPCVEAEIVNYRTFISPKWTLILALSTLIFIVLYVYKTTKKPIILILITVLSNVILFSILERFFSLSSYLRYHLGNQRITLFTNNFTFNTGYILIIISLIIFGYFLKRKYKPIRLISTIPFVIITLFIIQNFLISDNTIYYRNVLCYDITTGKEVWKNSNLKDANYEMDVNNSLATPTSLIMNNYIISYFGNCGLICANKISGETEWINSELTFNSYYGVASSPVQHNNKIYLLHGNNENQLISAINYQNGEFIWQNKISDSGMIYRPPLIRKIGGKYTIICVSNDSFWVFNEDDGKLIYFTDFESLGGDPVSSAIPDIEYPNLIYMSGRNYTVAFDLEKIFTDNFIVWKTKTLGANCASPIVYKSFLFILGDNGLLSCLNKNDGEILYKKKLSGVYFSSLSRAGKYLYLTNLEGITYVLEIGTDRFIEKSINVLNEKVIASIAFVNNKLLVRTLSSLVLIE